MSQVHVPAGDKPDQDAEPGQPAQTGEGTTPPGPPQAEQSGGHAQPVVVPVVSARPAMPQAEMSAGPAPESLAQPRAYPQSTPIDSPAAWTQQPWPQPMAQPEFQQQVPAPAPQLSWQQPSWQQPSWQQQSWPQGYAQQGSPQPTDWQPSYPQPAYAQGHTEGYAQGSVQPPYPAPMSPQQAYPQQAYLQQAYPQQAQIPAPSYLAPVVEPDAAPAPSAQPAARSDLGTAQVVEAAAEVAGQPGESGHGTATQQGKLAYEIAQEDRPSRVWQAIKWPLRYLIKGIYLTGSAAKNHRRAAIVLTILVLLLAASGYGIYAYTHPSGAIGAGDTAGGIGAAQDNTTPFTVVTNAQPPLAPGVLEWLHAYKTFNGNELWNSLTPEYQQYWSQQGLNADQLQQSMTQERNQGLGFDEFIYTGGYLAPNGLSHFSVEAVETLGDKKLILTWFFFTDPSGKIALWRDLTPSVQQQG